MESILGLDWRSLFAPSLPLGEIVLRGTVVYLALFTLLRVVLKREAGTVSMADLLMVVLIADAAQNAMASDYKSITDGLLLVSTIVFWNYMLDFLGHRSPRFRRLVEPPPLLIVKDGQMQLKNMRKELITEDELMGKLRERGIKNIADVDEAYVESDGQISVIPRAGSDRGVNDAPRSRGLR